MAELHAYSPEGALRFPLQPEAHEHVWRYLFDWVIAGEALHCAPGDLVLEFGAGPSFASELFNRLGYHSVALDLNPEILALARRRWQADTRLDARRAHFAAGDGLRLPFADAVFDGVICLNALHHMPDFEAALREIRRVLKPGARAAFSEPGSRHADSPDALAATAQGALERSIVVEEIERLAMQVGFGRMLLKPFVYPSLVELDARDFARYGAADAPAPYTRAEQIARFFHEQHPLFVLEAPGERPRTSAGPRGFGSLHAALQLDGLPAQARPGDALRLSAALHNQGPSIWLAAAREFGGQVRLGLKLYDRAGQLVCDSLPRAALPHDVAPGERIALTHEFRLPWFPAGEYELRADLVAEFVAWFETFGSPVWRQPLCIEAGPHTSAFSRLLNAALRVTELPTSAAAGVTLAPLVEVENTSAARWLHAAPAYDGLVTLGVQLRHRDGRVLNDGLGRTALPRDVDPGETVAMRCHIALPADLGPGDYLVCFDMVQEGIAWFAQYGSPIATAALRVEAAAPA
jgi:SAM-dependent methyltransferase